MKQIAIIGAGGLTGQEFIRLLVNHDGLELVHITSDKLAGKTLSEAFPGLLSKTNLTFQTHSAEIPPEALVVLAVPNQAALDMVPELLQKGHRVLDLSGAYRLHDEEQFTKYYSLQHTSFFLMEQVVFGMPELFRKDLQGARFVSNPGCYATSVILPLYLLGELREELKAKVVVDSKSGVSGAGGRTEDAGFSFNGVYENFRAYKILKHQHYPEMLEYSRVGMQREFLGLVFTPHLLPLYRGILSTFVLQFARDITGSDLQKIRQRCDAEPFVRFYDTPEEIRLDHVQNTNFLDLSLRVEGDTMVIVSALDNLQKGAAGQALQNINLMLGMEETKGLKFT
ncbi:MAG: N-acetyl-gamma-glutamyl-phosphate reductase [Spirochaetota bacterium]